MAKVKKVVLVLFAFFLYFVGGVPLALAQYSDPRCQSSGEDAPPLQCLEPIFKNVLEKFFALAGILTFLYLIAGGFKYLTAGGDEKAVTEAAKMITQAVFGLLIVVGAYALLRILSYYIFGAGNVNQLFQFNIPND